MMLQLLSSLVRILLFLAVCSAAPVIRTTVLSVSALLKIAPNSASCAGAPAGCNTASQAIVPMANSFNRYGISSPGEIAALISLMAYETGDFRYQVNLAGTPGQGTRNMQAARFNILYASSIPALAAQVKAITGGAATGRLSASQLNAVLALLTGNADYDWGSAAWFLTTQCPGVRTGLQSATLASWQNYIQNCIGIAPTGDRQAGWTTAKQALGT